MNTSAPDTPRRSFARTGLPLVILALAAAVAGGAWYWPGDWDRHGRVMVLTATALITTLLLAFWALFLSSWPRWARVLPVLLVIASPLTVRGVRFDGDMLPSFEFRWSRPGDDKLEAHRAGQKATVPADVKVTDEYREDFPGYLGHQRDGVVEGLKLRPWDDEKPRELWRQPIGGGYAGFAVWQGRAVTIEQRRGEEAVVCYDPRTGTELWAHRYKAHFQEKMGGPGPRATPQIGPVPDEARGTYRVLSLGATGTLVWLEPHTGNRVWKTDILENNGNLQWGMSGSPLVAGGMVYVTPGAQTSAAAGRGVIAYDARTGKPVWANGASRGAYSSPTIKQLCRRDQLLVLDGDGLHSYDPKDGKSLWFHEWQTFPPQLINVAQPVVLPDDRVFVSSGYNKGCVMLQVKEKDGKWSAEPLWQNQLMRCKFATPIHKDGFLYGLDDGILTCLDAETGERRWKGGRYGHGQVLLVGEHLLVMTEKGELALVEASPEAHRERGLLQAISGKTWNPHAVYGRLVLVRNDREMACYELPGENHQKHPGIGQGPTD